MENLLFLLATSFAWRRPSRKFRNSSIGKTGCSALLMSGHSFESVKTACGDDLYFHQSFSKGVTYGIICVDLRQQCDLETAGRMLESYLHKLKAPLYILHHTGLATDADWNSTGSRAITDYWQDAGRVDWKVKGYTNGRSLAVLYVKNIGQVDVTRQEVFLDGFHFAA